MPRSHAFVGFLLCPIIACVDGTTLPPSCADGCVPQPCVEEYPVFLRPEFESAPANAKSVLDECSPTNEVEPATEFDCSEDRAATAAYVDGRLTQVQLFAGGLLYQEQRFEYSGDGGLTFFSRADVDGEQVLGSLVDTLTWNGIVPATENVTLLTPAGANGSPRSLDGEYRRYETARAWDERGLPAVEESRLGAEHLLAQRTEYIWTAEGELGRVVTTIDTGQIDEPELNWPGCDALGGGVFKCETTFIYESGAIVSFRTMNQTTAVSDHCCVPLCGG